MADEAAPARSDFPTEREWLAAWISYRLAQRPSAAVTLPGVDDPAVHLHGSIGYDSAITSRGEIWVYEYDLDGPGAFHEKWRPAGIKDGTGYLVIATRHYPELRSLLPVRTGSARQCSSCGGTGERHLPTTDGITMVPVPGVICLDCSGLGWLPG